ncbi:helicase C-terminal domain-containing protein [Virgisporangium ochraceum]|nr:helicase C-terminal domain-containing protein [Virgisporangium ochraceum]
MSRWLRGLAPAELAGILVRRPESAAVPTLRDLGDLAARLSQHHHVHATLRGLCAPAVQVAEAAQALVAPGDEAVSRAGLAELLGRSADDPELTAALEVLYQRALAWPADERVVLVGPLRSGFTFPLGLGRPAAKLFEARPADEVRRIGERLGLRLAGRNKQSAIEAVATRLGDPERVRALVDGAPEGLATFLGEVAATGPQVEGEFGYLPDDLRWAVERGLLVSDGWERAEMPREVSIALRGPGWHAPFTPRPPLPPLAVADAAAVEREAAAATAALLSAVGAVLDEAPFVLLRAGGLGAREIKRVSRATGASDFEVGFVVDLASAAGLLAGTPDEVLPSTEYDGWAAEPPAVRLAALVDAWYEQHRERSSSVPLKPEYGLAGTEGLRHTMLAVLAEVGGALPANGSLLIPLLSWHAPLALDLPGEEPATVVLRLWREAVALGLVARGVLSPLGRAVVDGTDLVAAAQSLVIEPAERATFQADLTAMVSGTPSVSLGRLLDSCAEREVRGAASMWRFTPASVRRALDGGATPEGLVESLRAAGTLPQAVEYLVNDVARRHGSLRVRAVGCVLHGLDPALLAEVTADRRLAPLGLAALTPTVLASTRPPAETLAALRGAGYAPVAEDATGEVLVDVPAQRRAERPVTVRRVRRRTPSVRPADAAALAKKLIAASESTADSTPDRTDEADRTWLAGSPVTTDLDLLDDAIAKELPVHIDYVSKDGRRSSRMINPVEITGGKILLAWCHLRNEERAFALSRILSVSRP